MREALNDLIEQAKSAQHFIERNGKNAIKEVAESFVRDLSSLIDQYGAHITDEVSKFPLRNSIHKSQSFNRLKIAWDSADQ